MSIGPDLIVKSLSSENTKKQPKLTSNEVKDLMLKVKDNPYKYGVNSIELLKEFAVLMFSDKYDRDKAKQKFKDLGIPVKCMSFDKAESSHLFRYELIVDY